MEVLFSENFRPLDCQEIKFYRPTSSSAVYRIYENRNDYVGVQVYCDMETDGGGWIVSWENNSFVHKQITLLTQLILKFCCFLNLVSRTHYLPCFYATAKRAFATYSIQGNTKFKVSTPRAFFLKGR